MISSISSAMSGMASAISQFDRASARIAQPVSDMSDPVKDRVEQVIAKHAFAANLATIRTADDMLGTLIDTIG